MIGEGEWKARKHGVSYRRQWRKVHIGIDAETFDIRAIEVTSNAVGDGQTLPDLLAQIPRMRPLLLLAATVPMTPEVAAAIDARGADPVIPVRRNGKAWIEDGPGVELATRRCAR
jgi:hypothetical protein